MARFFLNVERCACVSALSVRVRECVGAGDRGCGKSSSGDSTLPGPSSTIAILAIDARREGEH